MTMKKIVIVGGASPRWTPRNVASMALSPSTRDAEVVLVDVAHDRAVQLADVCTRMVKRAYGVSLRVHAQAKLADALPGADVVFTVFRNGGHDSETRIDAMMKTFGSQQNCFTAGPGAAIYAAVQSKPLLDLVRLMAVHCPNAVIIHGINPLPTMVMLAVLAGHDPGRVMGHCGAMPWYRRDAARALGVDPSRVTVRVGGTNHCTFFTQILLDGQDAYPLAVRMVQERGYYDLGIWGRSTTELDLLKMTGYLVAGGHASDIYPMAHGTWTPPSAEVLATREASARIENDENFLDLLDAYANGQPSPWQPPAEADFPIPWLDALSGLGSERIFTVNRVNGGAVPNLPDWSVPDVECYIDARGVSPVQSPPLPEHLAEVARRHQTAFRLAAQACLARSRDTLIRAIQLAPFGDYMKSAPAIVAEAEKLFGKETIF